MKNKDVFRLPTNYYYTCCIVVTFAWAFLVNGAIQAAQPENPTQRTAPEPCVVLVLQQPNDEFNDGKKKPRSGKPENPEENLKDRPCRHNSSIGQQSDQIVNYTLMNDVIHGNIEIHPLLMAIIDTSEFQRLRNIKMMTGTYYVFSGASHNYFEHAIGRAYLAGRGVKRLRSKQTELGLDENDVLCVQVAALCRDLGVGPFGHVYVKFLKSLGISDWKQANASADVFKHMVRNNERLQQLFRKFELGERDIRFIEEQIRGVRLQDGTYEGRDPEKAYLYQFVGTRQAELDAGQCDSILRDSYHLQIKTAFDHKRFIKFLRVITTETGERRICLRDKERDSIIAQCNTLLMQHRNAKDHKVAAAVELMIIDALKKADGHLRKRGLNGHFNLSTAHQDMVAYSKLDDTLFHQILHSRNPELAEAKRLLEDIESRRLYRFVDMNKLPPGSDVRDENLKDRILELFLENEQNPDDTVIPYISSFNFFGKSRNPSGEMSLYAKESRELARRQSVNEEARTTKLNQTSEYILRIYSRSRDEVTVGNIRASFKRIWQDIDLPTHDVMMEPAESDGDVVVR